MRCDEIMEMLRLLAGALDALTVTSLGAESAARVVHGTCETVSPARRERHIERCLSDI